MENFILNTHSYSRNLLHLLLSLWIAVIFGVPTGSFAADPDPAPLSGAPANNYSLSGNDVILVKVFQEPDLDSQHRLSKDGTITMPLIGVVSLGGKTVSEAASIIRDRLSKGYLRNPQVRVNIVQYAPRRFSVLGQVQRPGNYSMGEETTTDLLEAIALAGGFAKSADLGNVIIRRKVNGQEKIFEVNAKNMEKRRGENIFQIVAGDTIVVGERLF